MKPLEHYKGLLEKEEATLRGELMQIAVWNEETGMYEAIPEIPEPSVIGEDEAADRTEVWDERTSLVATLGARLIDVENALEKIEEKAFGICEMCNQPIEGERLDANCAARTCMTHINE